MTVAAVRPVPNLSGEIRVGDTIAAMQPDTKRTAEFTAVLPGRVAKLSLACDGAGGGPPTTRALLRAVVYQAGVLLGLGDEVVVMSGDPLRWVDLPLTGLNPSGVPVAVGEVEYGVIVGGDASVLRVAQIDPDPPYGGGRTGSDTYADGASNPFGSFTSISATTSIFATITPDWAPLAATTGDIIAQYGFADAQQFLTGETIDSPTYESTAAWHGTFVDDHKGSFAVVRAGGPLESLVGLKILVTSKTHTRSVYLYVFAKITDLAEDISIARRAFAELDLLSEDTLDVHIEVLA